MDFLITMGYFVVHCDGLETAVDFCWTRSRQMESHGRLWCRERTAFFARSWLSSPWKNKCPCLYSLCLSLSLSIYLSIFLSFFLSYLSIYLSYPSIHPAISLSVDLSTSAYGSTSKYTHTHIYIYMHTFFYRLRLLLNLQRIFVYIYICMYVCAWHYVLWYMCRFDIKYLAYIHSCA